MSTLETHWRLVTDLLRQACFELEAQQPHRFMPVPDVAAGNQFDMFLENNELGLAWDALASTADEKSAPAGCWEKLLLAAGLMSSAEQAHLAATRLCASQLPEKHAS